MDIIKRIVIADRTDSFRAPIAKYYLRMLDPNLVVYSMGTHADVGTFLSDAAKEVLTSFDVPYDNHSSQRISYSDLLNSDVVLCVGNGTKHLIAALVEDETPEVIDLSDFCSEFNKGFPTPTETYVPLRDAFKAIKQGIDGFYRERIHIPIVTPKDLDFNNESADGSDELLNEEVAPADDTDLMEDDGEDSAGSLGIIWTEEELNSLDGIEPQDGNEAAVNYYLELPAGKRTGQYFLDLPEIKVQRAVVEILHSLPNQSCKTTRLPKLVLKRLKIKTSGEPYRVCCKRISDEISKLCRRKLLERYKSKYDRIRFCREYEYVINALDVKEKNSINYEPKQMVSAAAIQQLPLSSLKYYDIPDLIDTDQTDCFLDQDSPLATSTFKDSGEHPLLAILSGAENVSLPEHTSSDITEPMAERFANLLQAVSQSFNNDIIQFTHLTGNRIRFKMTVGQLPCDGVCQLFPMNSQCHVTVSFPFKEDAVTPLLRLLSDSVFCGTLYYNVTSKIPEFGYRLKTSDLSVEAISKAVQQIISESELLSETINDAAG